MVQTLLTVSTAVLVVVASFSGKVCCFLVPQQGLAGLHFLCFSAAPLKEWILYDIAYKYSYGSII